MTADRAPTKKLTFSEVVSLNEIVKSRYKNSKMSITEFANSINSTPAERALFRNELNYGHLKTALDSLGISINIPERVLTQQELNNMFVERIASLEQLTEKLAKQIEKLEFKLGIDPS